MSTIKSSAENLTLNADGANNDIIFQSNGTTKATLDQAGLLTATSFAGSGANLTGITGVGGATGVDFNDNVKARFGTGNDMEIYHDGSNSYVKDAGTGNLILNTSAGNVEMKTMGGGDETMFKAIRNGAVELYHNDTKKFETIAGGARIPSGGLLFGSDTAAANALDDYEEGTFTLAMYSGQSGTITNHFAKYTKIGRNVTLNFRGVINDAKGNNYVRISGFPFSLPNIHYPATANYSYSQSVQLFMSNGGYFYYQSTTVNGNNQGENTAWLNDETGISINVTYVS